jgi:carbohydrate diacid regulator
VADARDRSTLLTTDLAQEIAAETAEIIGFNVLITDPDGAVIGSGAVDRVGSVHEASLQVMKTLRPAWHSAEEARRLHGVRPGITLPIVLDGEALGTVGITGSPRQVRRFGLLVQRHTEILVREAFLVRSRLMHERAVTELVRDIAFLDAEVLDVGAVEDRARELGVDLDVPRVAVVIDLGTGSREPGVSGGPPHDTRTRSVREVFHDARDVVAEIAPGRFAVLHAVDDEVRRRCEQVVELFEQRHGQRTRVGLSDPGAGVRGLHDAYRDADSALRVAPSGAHAEGVVVPIAALRVPQLLAAAPPGARGRFTELVLRDLREEPDWPALRDTLIAWAESGFNLVRAAAALHIHRNTLIYRLNKVSDRSGQPARDPRTGLALYLACLTAELDA